MSKIFAINAGSSSLKFQLFAMPEEEVLTAGLIERIGFEDAVFTIKVKGEKVTKTLPIKDHGEAVALLLEALIEQSIVTSLQEIDGVGHRMVHGGEQFAQSVIGSEEVLAAVEEFSELAPLHNPANLTGYRAFKKALPKVGHVFVFDTAFHQTMEPETYLYPLPYEYYTDMMVRKYGFHGTSHDYVSERVGVLLGSDRSHYNIIVCHLGNGASICAVKNGKSINTSMGFTPLAGIMMGTRSGDVDPGIMPYLMDKLGKSAQEILDVYNKKSGMLGVSGISSDARDIDAAAEAGNERAILTNALYTNIIAQTIGAYAVQLGHVDAIAFTAGLGENACGIRAMILDRISELLQIKYDEKANQSRGKEICLSTPDSKVAIWVVPTNEELMIARDTKRLLGL
ncbi:MAG: acetate kinase [Erysipelotrichaceae bacterium]|jgi:acetate kinase|nr:acetate kinase [Erysipelotrichaceae bacterium]